MTLESNIREVCAALSSERAAERKRNAESLKTFLNGASASELLTENQRKKCGFDWNDVFHDVHNYAIKECEKFETSKSFDSVRGLCTSLLYKTISNANKYKVYLKCDNLIESCLLVLRSSRHTRAFGFDYINLLGKYVLTFHHYLENIRPSHYEEIYTTLLSICLSDSTTIDRQTALKVLLQTVQCAVKYCQFVIPLRDSIYNVRRLYDMSFDVKSQEMLVVLSLELLDYLSAECRLSVCEFTEYITPFLLRCYNVNMDIKKKHTLFRCLELILKVHHPKGVNLNQVLYPSNHIKELCKLICIECEYAEKMLTDGRFKSQSETVTVCDSFVCLTVMAIHQLDIRAGPADMDAYETPAKRLKYSKYNGFIKGFQDIIADLKVNQHPWLSIMFIDKYIQLYGADVTNDVCHDIMSTMENHLSAFSNKINYSSALSLVCNLLDRSVHTDVLWSVCVRNSIQQNISHDTYHGIIQKIITLDLTDIKQIGLLLKLYFENAMPVTKSSIKTITALYTCHCITIRNIESRLQLLRWLIEADINNDCSEEIFQLIQCLIIKDENRKIVHVKYDLFDMIFNSIEDNLLMNEFQLNFFDLRHLNEIQNDGVIFYMEIVMKFEMILMKKLSCSPELINNDINLNLLSYIDIAIRYLQIEKLGSHEEIKMELSKALKVTFNSLKLNLENNTNYIEKCKVLIKICMWFNMDYDEDVSYLIRVNADESFFEVLHRIVTSEMRTVESGTDLFLGTMEQCDDGLRRHCLMLMAGYCRVTSEFSADISKFIMDVSVYDFSLQSDVQLLFDILSVMICNGKPCLSLDLIFKPILHICKTHFRKPNLVSSILKTIDKYLPAISMHGTEAHKQNTVIMLKSFLERCRTFYYTPEVSGILMRCIVNAIIYLDAGCLFDALIDGATCGLNSVRLFVCLLVVDMRALEERFDDLFSCISQVFEVETSTTSETIMKDEFINRSSTALHLINTLAIKNPIKKQNLLFKCVELASVKSVNIKTIKTMLSFILKTTSFKTVESLMNDNLFFIMNEYCKNDLNLERFPVGMFGYDSLDEFVCGRYDVILPVDVFWKCGGDLAKSQYMVKLVSEAGLQTDYILKNIFTNAILLSVPHIVRDKYKIIDNNRRYGIENTRTGRMLVDSLNRMAGVDCFGEFFVGCIVDVLIGISRLLVDNQDLRSQLGWLGPYSESTIIHVNLDVYKALIKYFGEITSGNLLQKLIEESPKKIQTILTALWNDIDKELSAEIKVYKIHRLLSFYDEIPVNSNIDEFVCTFVCMCLVFTLEFCVKGCPGVSDAVCRALYNVLLKILPDKVDYVSKIVRRAIEILNTMKGGTPVRDRLVKYLCDDMRYCLKLERDATDGGNSSDLDVFKSHLMEFIDCVSIDSSQALGELLAYIKSNTQLLKQCMKELNTLKGFSDECKDSLTHMLINKLTYVICHSGDRKIIDEACSSLGVIGLCDLRTIVTMTPSTTDCILTLKPLLYLCTVILETSGELLECGEPVVVMKAADLLTVMFSFREGRQALDISTNVSKSLTRPFQSLKKSLPAMKVLIDDQCFDETFRSDSIFVPLSSEGLDEWAVRIAGTIMKVFQWNGNCFELLHDLCDLKPSTAVMLLPALMGLLCSYCDSPQELKMRFQLQALLQLSSTNKNIMKSVLEVVDFIRLQSCHYKNKSKTGEYRYNYMKLDYLKVATLAMECDMALYGIMYSELSLEDGVRHEDGIMSVLAECYKKQEVYDWLEGNEMYELTNLPLNDCLNNIETGLYTDAHKGHNMIARALHSRSLLHIASRYANSVTDCDDLTAVVIDCQTRLGDWEQIIEPEIDLTKTKELTQTKLETVYAAYRYNLLKDCLNTETPSRTISWDVKLQNARAALSKIFQKSNRENCSVIYEFMSKLQLLEDIDAYYEARCSGLDKMSEVLLKWSSESLVKVKKIEQLECCLWQRSMMLDHARRSMPELADRIMDLQLDYGELSVQYKRHAWSSRCMAWCKAAGSRSLMLESKVYHSAGRIKQAVDTCKQLLTSDDKNVRAQALRQIGLWQAECQCESARDILEKYLLPSEKCMSNDSDVQGVCKVYLEIGKFADKQYKQVEVYIKSAMFESKVRCMENMKGTADSLKSQQTVTRDERRAMVTNERMSQMDRTDITNTYNDRDRYRDLALKYYILSLRGSKSESAVFRIASLWCSGGRPSGESVKAVPSARFLAVLPQLIPRLNSGDEEFNTELKYLVERCCRQHPHHSLPLLLTQLYGNTDLHIQNYSGGGRNCSGRYTDDVRTEAAKSLVSSLRRGALEMCITQMESLWQALISLANFTTKSGDASKQKIPRSETLHKLKNLNKVHIPTVELSVSVDSHYDNIISIVQFSDEFELVGGINAPKKLTCRGSDGVNRPILLKGQDDLRQDAVVQQVFNIVNTLLGSSDNSGLGVRTYKVVPLSRRSGVVEWCQGSIPLGVYLIKAQQTYRPKDISVNAARNMMKQCADRGASNTEKVSVFCKILSQFKPVFRHFFMERYHTPVEWYERRTAYTNSVATWCMVGHVMGLGDRHVHNILLDTRSAQHIHIDFGIAFEHGKILPTPETVPFRLTQNIVDGFGVAALHSSFKRSCERTLGLLQDNSETLLSILEVLLYDPLYSWSVSRASSGSNGTESGQASRALLVLADKLQGRGVSIQGRVAALIQSATDPNNLARLYAGWQPFL